MRTLTPRSLTRWRTTFYSATTDEPMSTAELALYIGTSQRSVQRWEAGTQPIPGWLTRLAHQATTPDGFYRKQGAPR